MKFLAKKSAIIVCAVALLSANIFAEGNSKADAKQPQIKISWNLKEDTKLTEADKKAIVTLCENFQKELSKNNVEGVAKYFAGEEKLRTNMAKLIIEYSRTASLIDKEYGEGAFKKFGKTKPLAGHLYYFGFARGDAKIKEARGYYFLIAGNKRRSNFVVIKENNNWRIADRKMLTRPSRAKMMTKSPGPKYALLKKFQPFIDKSKYTLKQCKQKYVDLVTGGRGTRRAPK